MRAHRRCRCSREEEPTYCAKAQRGGFVKCGQIDRWMGRYALGVSLPDAPLREFETRAADLPRATEAERLVVLRIGQDIFRASLMDYWRGRCPLTGISDRPLLRGRTPSPGASVRAMPNGSTCITASSFRRCGTPRSTAQTFDDEGKPEFSAALSEAARAELLWGSPISLTDEHRRQLARHRERVRASTMPRCA